MVWQKGVSGNPAGRKPGSRHKLSEAFVADLGQAWQQHGRRVLDRLAREDPASFARITASLMPKQLLVDHRLEIAELIQVVSERQQQKLEQKQQAPVLIEQVPQETDQENEIECNKTE